MINDWAGKTRKTRNKIKGSRNEVLTCVMRATAGFKDCKTTTKQDTGDDDDY